MKIKDVKRIVKLINYPDHEIRVLEKGDGFLIQLRYHEADINDPEGPPVLQSARKWYVSQYATESEVVETVYAAALRSAKHRVREHFRYSGAQVYSPHFDVNGRGQLCVDGRFDKRK